MFSVLSAQFSSIELDVGNFKGTGAWGDIDMDGDQDIVISGVDNWSQPVTKIYIQLGDHSFVCSPTTIPYANFGSPIDIGDYNIDGLPDLLIGNTIFRNQGNYTFTALTLSGGGKFIDYDNDGDLDVVGFPVQRNDGNNVFTNTGQYLDGTWGDFNNDGLLDLFSGGNVLLNNGSGSYTSSAFIENAYGMSCLGDYDNDGDQDIFVNGDVYINTQNGWEFSPAYAVNEYGESLSGEGISWGDMDNDGDLDLIASSGWYQNNGGGSFSHILSLPSTVLPHGVSLADYDRDGDLDVLVIGYNPQSHYPVINRVYSNNTGTVNTPPSPPYGLTTYYSGDYVVFNWQPSWDEQTPVSGLTYSLLIPSVNFYPIANPNRGNGYTNSSCSWKIHASALIDQNLYSWSAMAIDGSRSGSGWGSSEISDYRPIDTYTPQNPILGGSTYVAQWTANPYIAYVNVYVSLASGVDWIQLNQYPVLGQSGSFNFIVPDTLSNNCRIKIGSVLNPNIFSVSGYFSIIPSAPWAQLVSPSSMNFGTAYLGWQSDVQQVVLHNPGSSSMTVNNAIFMYPNSPFMLENINLPLVIEAGSTANIGLYFIPQISGTVIDSLYISNDSVNNPIVKIRLQASGEFVPPLAPENVQLSILTDSIQISWDAVTQSIMGTPLVPDYYIVFFNGGNDVNGPYYYLDHSGGLSYIHDGILLHSDHYFYRVRAYKGYRNPLMYLDRSFYSKELTEDQVNIMLSDQE